MRKSFLTKYTTKVNLIYRLICILRIHCLQFHKILYKWPVILFYWHKILMSVNLILYAWYSFICWKKYKLVLLLIRALLVIIQELPWFSKIFTSGKASCNDNHRFFSMYRRADAEWWYWWHVVPSNLNCSHSCIKSTTQWPTLKRIIAFSVLTMN